MTRYLSVSLGASEPTFGHSIQEIERASGRPSHDVRLTAEIIQKVRAKIVELGLDPNDTTAEELYGALKVRLDQDEDKIRAALNLSKNAEANEILNRLAQYIDQQDMPKTCLALKTSVAKRLIKKKPPKATMKVLGYRSLDSMLKHEPVGQIYAAAELCESASWQRAFHDQYNKLEPIDFETRLTKVVFPKNKRWQDLAAEYVPTAKHNILCFKELGVIVMLPLSSPVAGQAITTLLLLLTYINDIRVFSSYAKLNQVRAGFGKIIRVSSAQNPLTSAQLAGQPVPWQIIQRFYGERKTANVEVFEPHIQQEDLDWRAPESILAELEPSLAFWQDSGDLCGLLQNEPVSLNALDVALSYCNHLSFKDRIVHFVQQNLWHELMMRYLNQENLEAALHRQLAAELVET